MADKIARAMAKQATDAVQGALNVIESNYTTQLGDLGNKLNNKIKLSIYTASSNGVTNIVHNLSYNSTTDDMLVFVNGVLLDKTDNYTENANGLSIDLVGWSLSSGDVVKFQLYKNVK